MNKIMSATSQTETNRENSDISGQRRLLSRDEIQAEYGISRRWLELAAISGEGPPFIKVSSRMVRYRRNQLEKWLNDREFDNTTQLTGQHKSC
jgi:predicted DNA-binding transcriptional regulator AlpA